MTLKPLADKVVVKRMEAEEKTKSGLYLSAGAQEKPETYEVVAVGPGGVGGAVIATLGLVTPSVVVILIVAAFLKAVRDSKWVSAAFYGLRPASTALVAAAGVSVVLIALVNTGASGLALLNWKSIALAAVLVVLTRWVKYTKNLHPIVFILASAIVGVVFRF